ncbi:hypothetical protein Pan44_16130 [Caulifigura coniformis]|uniref:Uncharacterized protein n=1 Tax=Caulifigura coniformis TaxID=2527983 RepID=A0A517SBS9_9PLAN|nr:hypothetical protein [Caulifigura coniformis]QDT53591.1 hypothetical protein Pan44_16130 [Caulifigura coniformis]
MAKKSESGNKSQAIRDALAANPGKTPKEITEIVTALGYQVTPAYVSIIKYNQAKASGRQPQKVVRRKLGGATGFVGGTSGMDAMEAAIALVKAAGGLDQAKQTLAMLESIRAVL